MVFVQKCAMKRDRCLPLLFGQAFWISVYLFIDFDALLLNHHQASIDASDFFDELLLGYWPRLGVLVGVFRGRFRGFPVSC